VRGWRIGLCEANGFDWPFLKGLRSEFINRPGDKRQLAPPTPNRQYYH